MSELSVDEIAERTWLSEGEAEVFDLTYRQGIGDTEAAESLGLKQGTVGKMKQRIEEKKEKSQKTVRLFDEV